MKSVNQIRQELAILIKEKNKLCTTDKEKNKAVDTARQEINLKYGKGWREDMTRYNMDLIEKGNSYVKYRDPSIYDGHTHGEHWMD